MFFCFQIIPPLQLNTDLDLPLCCLFPLRAMKLSLLLSPTHRDELPYKTEQIQNTIGREYYNYTAILQIFLHSMNIILCPSVAANPQFGHH